MRKFLLTAAALIVSASMMASELPVRSIGGSVKKLNSESHHSAAREAVKATNSAPATIRPMVDAPANAIEVPFKHTLGKNDAETGLYSVIDVDGDGRTWKPSLSTAYVCMAPNTDNITANNDWLVSPPIHLLEGKSYTLSIDFSSALSSGKEERVAIYMGAEPAADALTTEIVPVTLITTANKYTTVEKEFSVPASGYYYIGFHCTSVNGVSKNTRAKDFSISETKAKVDPPVAGALSYQLAPKGELKATVTYTAPTMTQGGEKLEAISKVEVKTNWVVTHTFDKIAPGETVTFETELYNNGYNRLEATAYVDDTPGETAIIKDFYAGPDNPLPVENLKIALSDDYKHVTLTWDPIGEVGEKGGYVDSSRATYYIFDAFGSYYDPALAETGETSYTFDYSDFKGQDFVAFQVTAGIDETYYSLESTTDIVTIGTPDALPWHESFSDAYYAQLWAIDPASTTSDVMCGTVYDNELQTNMEDEGAEPEYLNSQDSDNGFFYFMPLEKDAVYGFFSTKIDVSKAENPVFEFYYQGKGSEIDAMIAENGDEFKAVRTIDLKASPTDGWTLCRIPLDAFKDARYVQVELRLRAVHNTEETTWSVPLDNIRVRDLTDTDIRIASVSAPESVKAGEPITVKAVLENLGSKPCAGLTASLYRNDELCESKQINAINADALATVELNYATSAASPEAIDLTVKIDYDNNPGLHPNSASAGIEVKHSIYPAPTVLNARDEGTGEVTLNWPAPDFSENLQPTICLEDFDSEDYTPLTIKDFGGWTMIDADGLKTYTFMKDTENPYRTERMAFQLYDPTLAGVPDDYMIDVPAHSGNRFLAAWSAQGQNDNWLISPELSGNAQTVKFFARSFTSAYPEAFEVYSSSTGKAVDDFTQLEAANYPEDGAVSEDWTEYTVAIPEGAKYFAIRHTAYDTYALFIDDITYEAAPALPTDLSLTGFNVYRDGKPAIEVSGSETSAVDSDVAKGVHTYQVSAVYNYGESRATEPIEITVSTPSAIDEIGAATGVRISVAGNELTISGAEGRKVIVAGVDGRVYFRSAAASAAVKVVLPQGVYVVKAGEETAKVTIGF